MNSIIIAAGLGILGLIIGYFLSTIIIKGGKKRLLEESNRNADLVLQEARLTAKRITDEADVKAEKSPLPGGS